MLLRQVCSLRRVENVSSEVTGSPMLLKRSYKYKFAEREHDESICEEITKRIVCQTNFMGPKTLGEGGGGTEAKHFCFAGCCIVLCLPTSPPMNEESSK